MASLKDRFFYLFFLPAGHFAVDTPGGALFIIAPAIGAAWDLSPAQIGLIITAHNVGAGLGYFPSGILGDRIHRRGLVLLAMVWWAVIGYLAASFAGGYGLLLVLLMFGAIGDAGWHPTATGTMVQKMPSRRALALGVHLTGGIFAEVIGPITAGFLLAFLDWRSVLQISVIPAVVMGLSLLWLWPHFAHSQESRISAADVRQVFAAWLDLKGLRLFMLAVSYSMAYIALLAMTPLYLQEVHGFSSALAGMVFAAMLLAGGATAPVLGRMSDQFGRKQVTVVAILVGSAGVLLFGFSTQVVGILIGAVASAAAFTGVRPVLLAAAVEVSGKRESTSLGLFYVLMDGIGALGALLAGLVGSVDLRMAFVFAAGAAGVSACFALAHGFEASRLPSSTSGKGPIPR